ncbi:ribosomal maturation YjgA family protein [Cellulomonas cellasea]|uniref:DUF2809 domain-containing protein n=1 Tax=Cellulomonas cellasea TaxID=43670 RepID=A0A4Y3KXB8_9CELL|nr:DUF2809 domain-containing protein [Cellulomonas cellasea]GEA87560.1 hypothetical protein CCE01nite_15090 [Cellulomonas cellasea]
MRRRPALAVAALVTVAAGLAVRSAGSAGVLGAVSGPAGDALYAVLVYALVGVLAVRARPWVVAAAAWALSAAVETAQLTALPAAVVGLWEPARWVLGTTFHAPDLASYAVGAVLAALVDTAVTRRRRQRARDTWASEPPPPAARRSTR